jgi:Rrf2 family protein
MNITSKSRYALKIMMDLAEAGDALVHRSDISMRQGIPLEYMDQILSRLREGGLIESTRGRSGGYRLSRPASEVSTLEIFMAVEDAFEPVQCLDGGKGCLAEHVCSSKDAWGTISSAIRHALSGIILSEIVTHRQPMPFEVGLQECRAPRRRSGASKSL